MKKLMVFDGCAGTGSATQAFRDRGHTVETLDIVGEHTYVMDIRDFHPSKPYDFMWFSPPCQCFSVAALSRHWPNGQPTNQTIEAIGVVEACLRIIRETNPPFWMIENPRGMLRKIDIMQHLSKKFFRSTVTYCQYGDTAMKPTDLWHNILSFHPLWCKPMDKCHVNNPRGKTLKGSTQWKTTTEERAKVPYALSLAICKAVEGELGT